MHKLTAALLLLAGAVSGRAEVKVLRNFTLIDGTGGRPASGSAMIVDSGRIRWVGPVGQLKIPAGAEVVDLTGKFVMPGIIDLHVHLGATVDLDQSAANITETNVGNDLRKYAEFGVTTVLSMGTDKDFVLAMRDRQRAGRPKEARIFSAGEGLVFAGGYGGLAGVTGTVATPADVERAVAELARKHVDIVKEWVDDHLGTQKKMPLNVAVAGVESAHRHGLHASAHVFYLSDARGLAAAGVNGFAHMVRDRPVDEALIRDMKTHGVWQQAATLSREASMMAYAKTPPFISDPFFLRAVSPAVVTALKSPNYQKTAAADPHFSHYPEILQMAEKNFKRLVDGGVRYGFGTDAGPPGRFPGYADHWELQLMVEAGLTPSQAITAATKSGAEFLGAADLGTLQQGKWADLVVLDRDPLANILNSRAISSVYVAGNKVR
ncbi:MAG: amidohydrolase family protein [Acidobacteriota bacterium]|nr:amidohydrolase family protein [Acidobacteriota bacterium]